MANGQVPIYLLTGFLGSGKTTVLNHLLKQPELGDAAVIINEFGEIGLDHELVESSTDNMVVLQSGCLCCTIRGDLVQSLHGLFDRRQRGEITPFSRVIIETTGLADPAPVIHTLMTDTLLSEVFRLDDVIATVDSAVGMTTLDAQEESVKQVAVADRIILTKTDLVGEPDLRALEARLRALNPAAVIIHARDGVVAPFSLFNSGSYNPGTKCADVQKWLNAEAYSEPGHHHGHDHHNHDHTNSHDHHHHHHDLNRHDDRISAVSYTVEDPIPAALFDKWLETLMIACGQNILRMKGIVHVEGAPAPFVLHGVQHIFHPPVILKDWAGKDSRSRIVLIGRDLTDTFLRESFGFLGSSSGKEHAHDHHHEHEHEHEDAGA